MATTNQDNETVPIRINGSLMPNYIHQKAVLIGFITRMDPDGKKATIRTTDEKFVQVVFNPQVSFPLASNQLIECYGKVKSSHQFECEEFAHFMAEISSTFNCKNYNKFIKAYINNLDRLSIKQPIENKEDNEPLSNSNLKNFEIDFTKSINIDANNSLNETINDFDDWN